MVTIHEVDPSTLQVGEPDPATLLPDDKATHLAELLTDAAAQANDLAAVLTEAAVVLRRCSPTRTPHRSNRCRSSVIADVVNMTVTRTVLGGVSNSGSLKPCRA